MNDHSHPITLFSQPEGVQQRRVASAVRAGDLTAVQQTGLVVFFGVLLNQFRLIGQRMLERMLLVVR
jgi:hypothetical protein